MKFASERARDANGRFLKPTEPSTFDRKSYLKEYHVKHKEKKIERSVLWNRNNKERRTAIKKLWRQKNREHVNHLRRLYLYRKKNAVGSFSMEEAKELIVRYSGYCAYCLKNKSSSLDHVLPLSKGGTNNITNLVPACTPCNSIKRDKLVGPIYSYYVANCTNTP